MSWVQSSQDPNYVEALQATESLGSPAHGFFRIPEEITVVKALPVIIKQNNLLIEQITNLHKKIDILSQKIVHLESQFGTISSNPQLQEALTSLTNKLNQVKLTDKTQVIPTPVRRIYHFQNPKLIFEKELKGASTK